MQIADIALPKAPTVDANGRPATRPGRTVRFVSAHMDARDWGCKQQQITQVVDHLLARAEADVAGSGEEPAAAVELVVCGDMNVCPQKEGEGGHDDGTQYTVLAEQFKRLGRLLPIASNGAPAFAAVPTAEC